MTLRRFESTPEKGNRENEIHFHNTRGGAFVKRGRLSQVAKPGVFTGADFFSQRAKNATWKQHSQFVWFGVSADSSIGWIATPTAEKPSKSLFAELEKFTKSLSSQRGLSSQRTLPERPALAPSPVKTKLKTRRGL